MYKQESIVPPYHLYPVGDNVFLVSGFPFVYLSDIKSLVFGDIHFGLETAIGMLNKFDGKPNSMLAEFLLHAISNVAKLVEIKRLILNGDIKHETYNTNNQEKHSLSYFLNDSRILSFEIVLVKGNHDKLIDICLGEVIHPNLSIVDFLCIPPYCIFHGHINYIQKNCKYVVLSHEHPAYIFRGDNFEKVRTMAFVTLKSKTREFIVILPHSNFISSGVIFPIRKNMDFLSPYLMENAIIESQQIYPFSKETGILPLPSKNGWNRD